LEVDEEALSSIAVRIRFLGGGLLFVSGVVSVDDDDIASSEGEPIHNAYEHVECTG
jgi:hypothetical protein